MSNIIFQTLPFKIFWSKACLLDRRWGGAQPILRPFNFDLTPTFCSGTPHICKQVAAHGGM